MSFVCKNDADLRLNKLSLSLIFAVVGLVYINLLPDYKLPSYSRFGQYRVPEV